MTKYEDIIIIHCIIVYRVTVPEMQGFTDELSRKMYITRAAHLHA
jgi:hypothetical protein